MATLMQKDVLLEMAAAVRGRIFYNRLGIAEDIKKADSQFLTNKRELFYSSFPENLDYPNELKTLQQLKQKYEGSNV